MKELRRRGFTPAVSILESRELLSTFTVTSLADTGPGSLRAAVQTANLTPGADTVVFAPALFGGTIALTSGAISITDNVTIHGLGASSLAVSGSDSSRIFDVSGNITASIDNLALVHGRSAINGGAIQNLNSTVNLSFDSFAFNHAASAGGAIASGPASHLNVTQSQFSFNTSDNVGGAIAAYGTTSVTNTLFGENSAVGWGGAVFNMGLSTDLSHDTFTANETTSASGAGGAVMSWLSDINMGADTFSLNSSANGGGYAQLGGVSVINSSQFNFNQANEGGAIFERNDSPGTLLNLLSSSVTFNNASVLGGGVRVSIGTFSASGDLIQFNSPDQVQQI